MPLTLRRTGFVLLLIAGCLGAVSLAAHAQESQQRLILKDGSYQLVVKYEMQGDRVHYLSAERYEWEDLPANLVDWDATKKYNDALSSGKLRSRVVETPEEKEEREKEEANSPEISPGLRLPGSGGVFLFDQFQGKPELVEIVQNGSEAEENKKKAAPRTVIDLLTTSKQNIDLKGEHAPIQSHVARPVIYIDINEGPQSNASLADRFRLVRTVIKKDVRIVGIAKTGVSGNVTEHTSFVPATVSKLGTGDWLKLTPNQDLAAGEYAVVEMVTPEEMNLYVWDFGVNPGAPANPNSTQPGPAE